MEDLAAMLGGGGGELIERESLLTPTLEVIETKARKAVEDFDQNIFFAGRERLATEKVFELAGTDIEALEDFERAGKGAEERSGGCGLFPWEGGLGERLNG
jgi:hypothetical protein